jgi:hypothetical protein
MRVRTEELLRLLGIRIAFAAAGGDGGDGDGDGGDGDGEVDSEVNAADSDLEYDGENDTNVYAATAEADYTTAVDDVDEADYGYKTTDLTEDEGRYIIAGSQGPVVGDRMGDTVATITNGTFTKNTDGSYTVTAGNIVAVENGAAKDYTIGKDFVGTIDNTGHVDCCSKPI